MKNREIETRIALNTDIEGVLNLQSRYLFANMSEEARKQGFVTTPFTITQLKDVIAANGLFIAVHHGEIVGYAFAGDWSYFNQWPIFPLMVSRFPMLNYKDWRITTENSFQYGPVCLDLAYRSRGLLNQLFETMRLAWVKKYPLSITFINQVNERSTQAHTRKLGWEIIDKFTFNGNNYLGLAFEMKKSVLIS